MCTPASRSARRTCRMRGCGWRLSPPTIAACTRRPGRACSPTRRSRGRRRGTWRASRLSAPRCSRGRRSRRSGTGLRVELRGYESGVSGVSGVSETCCCCNRPSLETTIDTAHSAKRRGAERPGSHHSPSAAAEQHPATGARQQPRGPTPLPPTLPWNPTLAQPSACCAVRAVMYRAAW